MTPKYVSRISGEVLESLGHLIEHSGCEKCKMNYAKLYLNLLPIYSENDKPIFVKYEEKAKKVMKSFNIKHYGMSTPPLEQTQEDFERSVNNWKELQKHG